ncbi:IS3 family transposase [Pseudoflavitalea sp. G-6-1-2]|uniref:IS3 family transposase n=1 Tax=Pseudoflavitalea sp. G-6-1-2 TaxID=2728841 RepID=UPI00146A0427|nr:IS3 family transposase [Pseudoflavitalea sp. G-6-1-2]NML22358.1 IS3 family transposase [Pseudoflavitalea sp. G-6-1-2]
MKQVRVKLKVSVPVARYSESFKRQVVREFERGGVSKDALQVKYGIKGKSRVLDWCRKYGKFAYESPSSIGRPMKDPQKQRIKELEKQLEAAELKLKVYDKLIEITNRELETDVIKKIEAEFVQELAAEKEINLTAVCRQLGYSKQAYYKSIRNRHLKACHESVVKSKVLAIRAQMPRLGTRKLYKILKPELQKEQLGLGRDKLFSLLRSTGLLVSRKKRYVKTTDSRHWMRKHPNLLKGLEIKRPEQVWAADITYLSVGAGYCYLHLLTDAYSRKIVGYNVSKDLSSGHTVKALQDAVRSRQYKGKLIHHSDRGLQYCSTAYVNQLKSSKILISMTEDGSPYDNALAERVNGILKDEFGLDESFEDIEQVNLQVRQAIYLYNEKRPHMSCEMLTPNQMHQQRKIKSRSWKKKAPEL